MAETEKRPPWTAHDLEVVEFRDVKPKPVNGLWPGVFYRDKFNLIAGEPSTGKTMLALSIAATISRGGRWPFTETRATPAPVIYMSAEDDIADTLLPRALAANADRTYLSAIRGVWRERDGNVHRGAFKFARDLEQLRALLRAKPLTAAVIVDPILSQLGADDTHRDSDIREVLGPVADLAAEFGVAIIGIAHLNKGQHSSPLARVMGSTGLVAAARSVYMTLRHDGELYFLPIKNNLAPDSTGYTYQITEHAIGGGIVAPAVEWTGQTERTAADLLRLPKNADPAPKLAEAREFLLRQLEHGPQTEQNIRAAWWRHNGLEPVLKVKDGDKPPDPPGWRTVQTAKKGLNLVSRVGVVGGGWRWYTPEQDELYRARDCKPPDCKHVDAENTPFPNIVFDCNHGEEETPKASNDKASRRDCKPLNSVCNHVALPTISGTEVARLHGIGKHRTDDGEDLPL